MSYMLRDGRIEPGLPQPADVVGDMLRAGQDQQVRAGNGLRMPRPAHGGAGYALQRRKFIEIADSGVGDDHDRQSCTHGPRIEDAVFLGQSMIPP
jgi:hypothetical protein